MKRLYILAAVLTVLVVGGLLYFNGGGQAPSGQLPLERLSPKNLVDIKSAFNADQKDVRVLLLLSPT